MIGIQLIGRLGNQLFQYAAVRSIAERNGWLFTLIKSKAHPWEAGALFGLGRELKFFKPKFTFKETTYEETLNNIGGIRDNTLLRGYFRSENFFNHDKVRKWFVPQITVGADYDNTCFIHFRGGDYNVYPWNMYQLPRKYYYEAMDKMREIKPDIKFAVVTDDEKEAHERFPELEIIHGTKERDFTMLMSAKYLIISNSTFSWWVAWLNLSNIVIAPKGWILYNINNGEYDPRGIKVERWIWI